MRRFVVGDDCHGSVARVAGKSHRVDDELVALPAADRMAAYRWLEMCLVRMASPISVDMPRERVILIHDRCFAGVLDYVERCGLVQIPGLPERQAVDVHRIDAIRVVQLVGLLQLRFPGGGQRWGSAVLDTVVARLP